MDPIEECYYTLLTKKDWRHAKSLSSKIASIATGANTHYFSPNSGAVGKAGELVFERYLQYYCDLNWEALYKIIVKSSGDICDFVIADMKIDVKTRTLKPADQEAKYGNYDRTIHIEKFPMMVSDIESEKVQDIYVCCGYNIKLREGYILGWASYEEVMNYPVVSDLKYPARCVPVGELHPIQYLLAYIEKRSDLWKADA